MTQPDPPQPWVQHHTSPQPQYQYPPPPYGYPMHPYQQQQWAPQPATSGMSTAGMVLGIVSISLVVLMWNLPAAAGIIPGTVAVVGLILSIVGSNTDIKHRAPTGRATAGIVCSAITLLLVVVALVSIATDA